MTDYQKWLERVDNLLQVQRDRCLDLISANFTRRELIELKMMIEVLMEKVLEGQEPKSGWIPVKTRPMTEEETEHYSEYTDIRIDDTYTILDCPLPDDGQEILVSWGGNVMVDVFVRDNDGCYFEGVDIDEADAWCPLPKPYKA